MSARDRMTIPNDPEWDATVDEILAEHRAEVLAADGQAYPGELAALRTLVRELRPAARYEGPMAEVQGLLAKHAAWDAAQRAGAEVVR